ncbi:cysteine dioxygenase [Paenibacillus flagellatus]|uniref:Cysteine dioxygenase n=1 Tax=Paenibacillus flagellatus TaxID=2211139 RepID=A0A2V5KUX3_9BACL|nr:cysteine dioxygenase family protein [Paenibacillus flagellatus]PYI55817.1 cysteine dioxygenase [Paenibacillus flagellatus]
MTFLQRVEMALSALHKPTLRELRETLSALLCTPEAIAPYVTEPDGLPYGRNVLFRTEEAEAIVVHLPGHTETYIHDHGASFGCAQVVEGVLVNSIYRAVGENEAAFAAETRLSAGQFVLAPPGQVHRMSNPTEGRTVSLHVYAPPLSGARTYSPTDEYVLDYVI